MGGIVGCPLHLRHDSLGAFIERKGCSQLVVASKYVGAAWIRGIGWATLHTRTVLWRQEESSNSKGFGSNGSGRQDTKWW